MSATSLFDMSGRGVWVIGGAGYLGMACCEHLARCGAKVFVADMRAEAADGVAKGLNAQGLDAESLVVDMGQASSIEGAVEHILTRHGRIDAVINMATYSAGKTMKEMTLDEWNKGLQVTLTGAFLMSRAVAPAMIRNGGGSIVQFSSMYGVVSPDPRVYEAPMKVNPLDYGVSKAGILQMVRYQAVAWGRHGVRVNAIVPGPFPNPANPANTSGFVDRLADKTALRRVGRQSEVAGAVVYLASSASSYVTGTQITIDGGWTAW